MIDLNSTQFWIAVLFLVQFIIVVFLYLLSKRLSAPNQISQQTEIVETEDHSEKIASEQAARILELLEPMLRESRKTAQMFDEQIKEKRHLINELNDALDNRIINLNLMISRVKTQYDNMVNAEAEKTVVSSQPSFQTRDDQSQDMGVDLQNQIIQMYDEGEEMDTIASSLSVPRGEVQMVIDLKKKFLEMEQRAQ